MHFLVEPSNWQLNPKFKLHSSVILHVELEDNNEDSS
jgi:hypothetical protein